MLKSPARQLGLSLIEVMVAITLAAILLALGMPSFFTGMQNRQIRTAADAIQNGLQMARTEALRRNRTIRFAVGANNGWTVTCDPADPTLENGVPICPGLLMTREGSEGSANAEVESKQMLTGTTTEASSPVFSGSLKFTPLGRVTADTLPGGSVAVFTVTNPRGGTCQADSGDMRCLRIVVTTGGQVRMCDPAVTAVGDPRRCNELLPPS